MAIVKNSQISPFENITTEKKNEILEKIKWSTAGPCVLCGSQNTSDVGCFVPSHPEEFGAPQGHARHVFFAICKECRARDDYTAQIKAACEIVIAGAQVN